MSSYNKSSALNKLGYSKECYLLQEKLEENHRGELMKQAMGWAKIPGVKVNYSFFENHEKNNYTQDEVIKAFSDLGVKMGKVKNKKWYQFGADNWNKKFLRAIQQLHLQP